MYVMMAAPDAAGTTTARGGAGRGVFGPGRLGPLRRGAGRVRQRVEACRLLKAVVGANCVEGGRQRGGCEEAQERVL